MTFAGSAALYVGFFHLMLLEIEFETVFDEMKYSAYYTSAITERYVFKQRP